MSNEILDKMTPKDLAMYWKNRRWMAWGSFGALVFIMLLGAAGIVVKLGSELAWFFASIIYVYFIGNAVVDIIDRDKKS